MSTKLALAAALAFLSTDPGIRLQAEHLQISLSVDAARMFNGINRSAAILASDEIHMRLSAIGYAAPVGAIFSPLSDAAEDLALTVFAKIRDAVTILASNK